MMASTADMPGATTEVALLNTVRSLYRLGICWPP